VGQADLIEALERVKNSFNAYPLDRAAIAGGSAAMADKDYFEECSNKIIATRIRTSSTLENFGFEVLPSKANFVFAKPIQEKISKSAEELYLELKENGVLVRYFSKRITIGTDAEMDIFFEKMNSIIN